MKSEFATLLDLASSRGVARSDVLAEIHREVLVKFFENYPKSPADAAVLVNEVSGDVRVFSGDRDITPPKFAPTAATTARQVILGRLAGSATEPIKANLETHRWSSALGNLFFFGSNIYFLFFNFLWVISFFSGDFWSAPGQKLAELGFLKVVLTAAVFVTPALAMYLAVRQRWYKQPGSLMTIFFLFELPILAACLIPLALITQTTSFMSLVVLVILTLPGVFYLFDRNPKFSLTGLKAIYFIQQLGFFIGSYLVFLYSFWVPAIIGMVAAVFISGIGNFGDAVFEAFVEMGFGLLLILLVMGLLMLPYLIWWVVWKTMDQTRKSLAAGMDGGKLFRLEQIFAVTIVTGCLLAAYQPGSEKLLKPLGELHTKSTFADKEETAKLLVPQKDKLAKAINNITQARHRYLFSQDDQSLKWLYRDALNFSDDAATAVQKLFLKAAYPLVYRGSSTNTTNYQKNYYYLFGEYPSSVKTQKPASATRVTNNVLLTYRKVVVVPEANGWAAKVSIEEEYDNQTYSQQEVIYEFNLPYGAVMVDLRLGPDLEFPGVIAPKGAAQRTYEREIQRRRDPALLEVTGPNQYRLRVFPVPAKNDSTTLRGRRQKVQYTYTATAGEKGYPLPQITRQTGVYTNASSRMFYTGKLGNKTLSEKDTDIPYEYPAQVEVCATGKSPEVNNLLALANIPDAKAVTCGTESQVFGKLQGKRIAIFYDVSGKSKNSTQLDTLVKSLALNKNWVAENQVDFYKYNDLLSEPVRLTGDNLDKDKLGVFFGQSTGISALVNFRQSYDLVFIYTGQETVFQATDMLPFASPTRVYLVGKKSGPMPMKLASATMQAGGVWAESLTEGLRWYLLEQIGREAGNNYYPVGRYLGVGGINLAADQIPAPQATDKTAVADLVNSAAFRASLTGFTKDISGDVAILDKLNEFSVQTNIVSPYSSLLALVNEQQMQTLEQLKDDYNRYQDQQMTEQTRIIDRSPVLDSVGPVRSPFMGLLDAGSVQLKQPMEFGGGGGTTGITNPSIGSRGGGYSALRSTSWMNYLGWMAGYGGLLVLGFVFYLVKMLRRHKSGSE